jgi:hypothetical protein
VGLQVWQKTTLGVVFCVGYIVTSNWALTRYLTYLGHFIASFKSIALGWKRCARTVKQTNNQPWACCVQPIFPTILLPSFLKAAKVVIRHCRKEPRFIPKDTPNSNEKLVF